MNNSYVTTATIRQRGQLTIPDKIRSEIGWIDEGSIVTVKASPKEIKILPYENKLIKKVNWNKLRAQLKRVRSFKGKRGNLSSFIVKDRESH